MGEGAVGRATVTTSTAPGLCPRRLHPYRPAHTPTGERHSMTDLQTALARMLDAPHQMVGDPPECDCGDWDYLTSDRPWNDHYRDELLATPQGKALSGLVEAAEAWDQSWEDDGPEWDQADDALMAAIDAYREATR